MLAVPQPCWACPRSRRTPLSSTLLCREPSEASPGLHAPPQSKLLRLRHSGSAQRRSLGWACALCPSQVRAAQVFGERGRCDLSPFPSLLFCFLGVQLAPLLRRMVTAQDPKKSQLAKKRACSLVVTVLLGLRLPPFSPSGSVCLSACHWRGMVCSRLVLFHPLFCAPSWRCLMLELFAW